MNDSDKDTSNGKSDTLEKAKAMGLCYASNGMLIGLFLCNPLIGILGGAAGYALGTLVGLAKENSSSAE